MWHSQRFKLAFRLTLFFLSFVKKDVSRLSDAYVVQVDMPGVAPETDLVVQTDANKLLIKGMLSHSVQSFTKMLM